MVRLNHPKGTAVYSSGTAEAIVLAQGSCRRKARPVLEVERGTE